MNRMTLAGSALLAVAMATVPVLAWSAGDAQTTAQAAPEMPGGGAMARPDWMRGGMRPGMMPGMQRAMERSPQQACLEHLARRAGFVAYIGAKLNLSAEQQPLWDKLQAARQPAAEKARQVCAELKPASEQAQQTVLDRISRKEQRLSAKLQALQQAEPAMQALYQTLTSEQKSIIDHPFRRG